MLLSYVYHRGKKNICMRTYCAYNTYYNIRLSVPIINNIKSSNPDNLIIIIINNDDNNVDFKEAIIIMLS
jgi:hypothetical protein